MSRFKSYFRPATKVGSRDAAHARGGDVQMSQWPLNDSGIEASQPPQLTSPRPISTSSYYGTRRNSTSSYQPTDGLFAGMATEAVGMLRAEVMANHLYIKQQENVWTTNTLVEGVVLKQARNSWVSFPPELSRIPDSLFDAIVKSNVRV